MVEARQAVAKTTVSKLIELIEKGIEPPVDHDAFRQLMVVQRVWDFYEEIGLLARRRVVRLALIDDYWGPSIIHAWKGAEPVAVELQKHIDRGCFEHWRRLANLLEARQQWKRWDLRRLVF